MNLTLDFGNTRTKLAVFDSQKMLYNAAYHKLRLATLKKILKEYSLIQHVIISSVVKTDKVLVNYMLRKYQVHFLAHSSPLPFKNKYQTPQSLGNDRMAVAAAAQALFPKRNSLIINCGTCITYDFINASNQYLGGSISPGVEIRLKALNHFTQRLPLIKVEHYTGLIGADTKSSILSGVINGVTEEIKGTISAYESKYKNLNVVLTGGDSDYLAKHIKNCTFTLQPHLTLLGLQIILQHELANS